ncbi:serine protease inhibitor 42Dd [Ceratitis capitata]|uniref:serine protease inhibitor 42Dd n=1 Tax=Ceratitis capitata TaxID=7213 RepID=UPI0006188861|nr:serine protease inhibitor 42Dd [Ceratitis capitata]
MASDAKKMSVTASYSKRTLSSSVAGSTLFQSELIYYTAKTQQTKNFVISPISLRSLLTILSIAVIRDPHAEILTVLGMKSTHQGIQEYKGCRNASRDDFTFSLHNSIYLDVRFEIDLTFKTICLEQFQTRPINLTFENREDVARNVNEWIAEQTEQQIKSRITIDTLDAMQHNLFVNIAHFESKWRKTFPKKFLAKGDFWLTRTEKISIDMMHDFCELQVGDFDDLKVTAMLIPYRNMDVKLLILLPKEIDGLVKLEQELKDQRVDLTSLMTMMKAKNVKLGLPRLKLETNLLMNEVLMEMGIRAIFKDSIDFTRLLAVFNVMRISQIRHISAIEFNEEGTSAAVTKVSFLLTEMENCTVINIDRPFFFAVLDLERIYFGGHITNTSNFLT